MEISEKYFWKNPPRNDEISQLGLVHSLQEPIKSHIASVNLTGSKISSSAIIEKPKKKMTINKPVNSFLFFWLNLISTADYNHFYLM